MPFPSGSARVILHGNFPGGEIWQCSFGMINVVAPGPGGADGFATVIDDAFNTNKSGFTAFMRSDCTYEGTTVYFYPSGGTSAAYIGNAVHSIPGTGSGGPLPLQCAIVITLRTGLAGRRNRGRMFWPATGAPLSSGNPLTTSTQATNLVDACAAFFAEVNAAPTGNIGTVAVISQTATLGHAVAVVDADLRLDIQRRRANQQAVPARVSATV